MDEEERGKTSKFIFLGLNVTSKIWTNKELLMFVKKLTFCHEYVLLNSKRAVNVRG